MLAEQQRTGKYKVSVHMILRISFHHLFGSVLFARVSPRGLSGGYEATSLHL